MPSVEIQYVLLYATDSEIERDSVCGERRRDVESVCVWRHRERESVCMCVWKESEIEDSA